MDILTMIAVVIPSVLSTGVSLFYAYLAYKKAKEPPKDEAWETASKILCSRQGIVYAEDFAELYSELLFVKENPDVLEHHTTIKEAMQARAKESKLSVSETGSQGC